MQSTIPADGAGRARSETVSLLPGGLLALLLLVATWFNGAFAMRHWAPVAILGLVIVAAVAFGGGARLSDRGGRVAVSALCAFAAWTVLSALWAESAGRALEGGARTLLYAALFIAAVTTPAGPRAAARLGGAVVAGVGVIAVITLVQLVGDGAAQFLAGRLDDPVGYRNATACLFAIAFWPLVGVAAHQPTNPLLRAAAFSGALLTLGLAFLTQSRGLVVGLLLGGVVAIALGPDRLRRTWVSLLVVGGLALASDQLLSPYRAFTDGRPEASADIGPAIDALVILVGVGFTFALAGALLDGGLRLGARARIAVRRLALAGISILVSLAVVALIAATGNPVTFAADRFDEFRSLETAAPNETRLTFGGGQRSDLWRIALIELSENPVGGVGESNYAFRYYEERRTDRNLSTPHSRAFELVAETGVVGTLLFLCFLGGIVVAVLGRWRNAPPETRWVASGLLAAAAVVLGQSAVDWIWLIPGVTGLAFLCGGLGLAALRAPGAERSEGHPILRRAAAALAVVAALGVTSVYLSDVDVRRARVDGVASVDRLDSARRAETLNPWAITPRYLQAGALEELGRPGDARDELLGALELEPANFVTLGLLGDFALRQGNRMAARTWYSRALRLNPIDIGLRELVRRTGG